MVVAGWHRLFYKIGKGQRINGEAADGFRAQLRLNYGKK